MLIAVLIPYSAYAQEPLVDIEGEVNEFIKAIEDFTKWLIPKNVTGNNLFNATDKEVNTAVEKGVDIASNVVDTTFASHGFVISLIDIFYDGVIDETFVNLIILGIIAVFVVGFIGAIAGGMLKLFIALAVIFTVFMIFGVAPALS